MKNQSPSDGVEAEQEMYSFSILSQQRNLSLSIPNLSMAI
jgi:hypothetical protein